MFTISLPCLGVATEVSLRPRYLDAGRVAQDNNLELQGVRILAVEDDQDSREMIELVLRSQGADVVSVGSVREALKVLERKEWKPEVLVSDLGMPEEDGYDLVRRLRSQPAEENSHIPAIAITGYAGNEEAARSLGRVFKNI